MQCVRRGEINSIVGTHIKPLKSELQVQLENVGHLFAISNRKMDHMSKHANEISHRADAASARISALVRARSSSNTSMLSTNESLHDISGLSLLGGGNNSMTKSDTSTANGTVLSEASWNRINNHLDASIAKCKREIFAKIDERLRSLESMDEVIGSEKKNPTRLLHGESSRLNHAVSLKKIQERVQQCYENVFKYFVSPF